MCFRQESGKYTFELCFFKSAKQKERKSSSNNLGTKIDVDTDGATKSITFSRGISSFLSKKCLHTNLKNSIL